jgi:DNA polymerase I-like protein with 3'-5' exonuclease and polymerase domains
MPLLKNYFATKIENEKENYAKSIASKMSTPFVRKKSFVELTGVLCAVEYFKSLNIELDTNTSLHKISSVLKSFQ